MKDKPLKTSQPRGAFVLGFAATIVILLACALGAAGRVDLMALDGMFRHFSPARPSDEILHVDIDDGSIERIGRWPWPRERLAGVIDVLDECGAGTIALDIILPDPQKVRYESPADEADGADQAQAAFDAPPTPVFDDALLAAAIERAHKVALPMHIDFSGADLNGPTDPHGQGAIAPRLHQRALEAMSRFAVELRQATGAEPAAGPMTPPLATFAEAADLSGFVTFTPDVDGVVRRIRLLGGSGGRVYMQLAMAMAADELAGRHGGGPAIGADEKSVTLTFADGTQRVIPTNRQGQMLIGWCGRGPADGEHISVSTVALVWELRRSLDNNNRLARAIAGQIAEQLAQEGLLGMFARADELYARRIALERSQYVATLNGEDGPGSELTELLQTEAKLEAAIDREIAELLDGLDFYLQQGELSAEDQAIARRVLELQDRLAEVDAVNAEIATDIDTQLARIRRRAAGRICIIGSTATSAADIVPTPLHPRTPGAIVHANIFNTILTGRFIHPAGPAAAILILLLAGAAVSAVAAWRPMLQAALAAAVLAAGYLAFSALAFGAWGLWLPIVGPLAAVVASYLAVAVFRQLTEQRAKQHIRKMFAHALSPALVDRLLVDPSLAQLGGQRRRITCMFSDLAGFTAMSERLGPQQTVGLLNRYFDRVTDVVQNRHEGYLNKFLGDGIFCFFGAPVQQPDHAARAVQAAIDCHRQVAELNAELAGESGQGAALTVRVGITTGEAMVGNCGSTDRMDYTAIGDCVNLASRLESANKLLGTSILITDTVRAEAHLTDARTRPIGSAMVSGFAEPIRLWQVLPEASPPPDRASWLADFSRAVELFEGGRFAEAADLFTRAGQVVTDDGPTRIYQALCSYALSRPAGETWQPPKETSDGVIAIAPPAGATGGE